MSKTNIDWDDVSRGFFWIVVILIGAAFVLILGWMIGSAVYNSEVLRHAQEIDCIKNLGQPFYSSNGQLQCHK